MKRRHEAKKNCMSSIASEFPEDCRFYTADTKDELHKVNYCFMLTLLLLVLLISEDDGCEFTMSTIQAFI